MYFAQTRSTSMHCKRTASKSTGVTDEGKTQRTYLLLDKPNKSVTTKASNTTSTSIMARTQTQSQKLSQSRTITTKTHPIAIQTRPPQVIWPEQATESKRNSATKQKDKQEIRHTQNRASNNTHALRQKDKFDKQNKAALQRRKVISQ